jgi:NADH-quinone oxidoreductase subunit A
MAAEFTPLFIFILLAVFGIAGVMVVLSAVLGPRRATPVKQMPYESGMDPIGDARRRFDVRYYLIAIAFLLFDVELLYLYPWAVGQWSRDVAPNAAPAAQGPWGGETPVLVAAGAPTPVMESGVGIPRHFRGVVFAEILVFIAVLAAAYVYAWRKGVFEWR